MLLVGRKAEIQRLERIYSSKEAEFIVLYGRRRVGKTFLIRQFFTNKDCVYLHVTGLKKGNLTEQLSNFATCFSKVFTNNIPIKIPESWNEALQTLNAAIENFKGPQKLVVFLDELPWMATPRSGLLQALDYNWNQYFSAHNNLIIIVCGSSASWLIKNIIYDSGGLHNRCTAEIKLEPFTLAETKEFLLSKSITLNNNHILELYMALGGIPYYLKYIVNGMTAAENIHNILFAKNAPLKQEFKKLFDSLFKNSSYYIDLIKIIAAKKQGVSRAEIEAASKYSHSGGRLTERLEQLEHINFIARYVPFNKEHGEYFKLVDEFCLFYLYWLDAHKSKVLSANHWMQQMQKPSYHVWAGYAFEAVCYKHIEQVIKALHIQSAESISSWRLVSKNKEDGGAQIDLVIDRVDDAITLIEIKYTTDPFSISKSYYANLQHKILSFQKTTKTRKQIFLAMISAHGIINNQYANELLSGVATLDDLFSI